MPAGGAWARLEVLASAIGAAGKSMRGLSIKVYGGQLWVDHIGSTSCALTTVPALPSIVGDRVWIEDDLPPGATVLGAWNWDTTQAAGGTRSRHLRAGANWGGIDYATDAPRVGSDDVIVTDVLLNPCRPTRGVMLELIDETGSSSHGGYWGENIFTDGSEGTASRMHIGPLPEPGMWARLEIPAVAIGLEGHALRGLYFEAYDGEVWFDRTGLFSRVNVAAGKNATLSSTYSAQTPASLAVDGATSGNGEAANAMTASERNPWLTIDLGLVQSVEHVVLWPRSDCCSARLSRFWLFVSDQPFASTAIDVTRAQAGVSSFYRENAVTAATLFRINRTARYLRVQLSGTDVLQLAELQAFAPSTPQAINAGAGASASQSATNGGASAELAVDGNVDGRTAAASSNDTGSAAGSWWQLDLGAIQTLSSIDIWNRTDCCQSSGFYVFVSDASFTSQDVAATIAQTGVTTLYAGASALNAWHVTVNRTGRYVRIQAAGTSSISLGEVQVWSQQQLLTPLSVIRVPGAGVSSSTVRVTSRPP